MKISVFAFFLETRVGHSQHTVSFKWNNKAAKSHTSDIKRHKQAPRKK